MAPPLPEQQQLLTPEHAFNNLLLLIQFVATAEVVHLSTERSVNLRQVSRYQAVEVYDEKKTGKGDDVQLVPFKPPQFQPALFFGSSEEPLLLDDAENAIFREAWQRHAHLTNGVYTALDRMYGVAAAPAAPAASDVQQPSEVTQ
jgi:hypothetical protein